MKKIQKAAFLSAPQRLCARMPFFVPQRRGGEQSRLMKQISIFTLVGLLLIGCASHDTRLNGRWKSNKDLSVATMECWKPRSGKPLSPHKRAFLASLFGKLIVTYDGHTATSELPVMNGLPPSRDSGRYRIAASDDHSLAYVSTNRLTGKPEISHVHFDGPNRYVGLPSRHGHEGVL